MVNKNNYNYIQENIKAQYAYVHIFFYILSTKIYLKHISSKNNPTIVINLTIYQS